MQEQAACTLNVHARWLEGGLQTLTLSRLNQHVGQQGEDLYGRAHHGPLLRGRRARARVRMAPPMSRRRPFT